MSESLKSILEMCKDATITVDEALGLIEALDNGVAGTVALTSKDREYGPDGQNVSWGEDGKLRIVAYIGKKLIRKSDSIPEFQVDLDDYSPMDVECWGSLECGDIDGNAAAGSYIACSDISQNATAGSHMDCSDIGGDATAGSHINCGDIGGNASAGGTISAGDIGGNASAGGNISCGDIGGDVRCNSMNSN